MTKQEVEDILISEFCEVWVRDIPMGVILSPKDINEAPTKSSGAYRSHCGRFMIRRDCGSEERYSLLCEDNDLRKDFVKKYYETMNTMNQPLNIVLQKYMEITNESKN